MLDWIRRVKKGSLYLRGVVAVFSLLAIFSEATGYNMAGTLRILHATLVGWDKIVTIIATWLSPFFAIFHIEITPLSVSAFSFVSATVIPVAYDIEALIRGRIGNLIPIVKLPLYFAKIKRPRNPILLLIHMKLLSLIAPRRLRVLFSIFVLFFAIYFASLYEILPKSSNQYSATNYALLVIIMVFVFYCITVFIFALIDSDIYRISVINGLLAIIFVEILYVLHLPVIHDGLDAYSCFMQPENNPSCGKGAIYLHNPPDIKRLTLAHP